MKNILTLLLLGIVSLAQAQERIVLIEQFSNSGCPTCATFTPPIVNYVNANPDKAAIIIYHTPFPYNDSMYHENPIESDARTAFYNVQGVPFSIADGNFYRANSSTFGNNLQNTITNRRAIPAQYAIRFDSLQYTGAGVAGTVTFTASENLDSLNLRGFVVAVEEEVLKSAYAASPGNNSESKYNFVMRKFLTDVNGVALDNKVPEGSFSVGFDWTLAKFKRNDQLRLIAFVQDFTTKEILNAQLINPTQSTGLAKENKIEFNLYPNPAKELVNIVLPAGDNFQVKLYNLQGQLISSEKFEVAGIHTLNLSGIAEGLYLVQVQTPGSLSSQRLVVGK